MRNFIVVGVFRPLVAEVLLAIHTFTDAHCIVVGGSKEMRILRYSNLCSRYLEASFSEWDDDRFVDSVNLLAESMPDVVLIPVDIQSTRMTNRVRNRLKARIAAAPDSSALDRLDNKWSFYQLCKEHGLNVPSTLLVGSKQELDFARTANALGIPFVVKPTCLAASTGVLAVSSEAHYDSEIRNSERYPCTPLIAQRFISGIDIDLNLLAVRGKVTAIAVQERVVQRRVGSNIRFISNDYLTDVAHTLARATAYDGVMHVDARIEDGTGKVFLFESNPRFWRSLWASVWCGLNFVAESIEPSPQTEGIRMLTSGSADLYHHPLYRPHLWRHAMFDRGWQGRMLRIKMNDLYTLATSTKTILLETMEHRSQVMALCENRSWPATTDLAHQRE